MGQLTFQATLGGAVNLAGPNTAATTTFTLPAADGTNGQFLQTNGTGTLSFASQSSQTYPSSGIANSTGTAWGTSYSTTGSGTVLALATTPTIATPNITTGLTLTGAAGTVGQVLTSSGSGSAPIWSTIASGGNITFATKTTTYTAVAGDKGYLFGCTGTWTLSLTAASTLTNGWYLYLQNQGTGVITVDPNSSETIGGVATAALRAGDIWLIVCNGTNFELQRLAGSNYQIFTSTATFTVPAGVTRIYAEAWGGGGGGSKGNSANLQGSGAGGGYSAGFINTTPGASITATVGSGGAGSTTNNTAGTDGGNTTFGALTANGGEKGKLAPNYGYEAMNSQGGTASGGDVNIQGGSCLRFPVASINDIGTVGGAAPASGGQGGRAAVNVNGPFGATQEPGIPGGGGYAGFASWSNAANGGRGEIRVYWV